MSKQPIGKTLLRNVIRHTDAHNKIQEEMEMWKMRGWEMQMSHPKETVRGQMHCDRDQDQPRDLSRSRERISEHDDREARYWTRKLYEFNANDPDRWGHSGFKELYPEEFESDGEKNSAKKKIGRHKMKKTKSDTEASLSKRSKKSSRKKKKKKKKKDEVEKRQKAECSSSSDDSSATKDKQRRTTRTKSRHKNKKTSKTRRRDEDSSSGDSEGERERRTHGRRKRKQNSHNDLDSDSGPNSKMKRSKTWKAAGEEGSDNSSGD